MQALSTRLIAARLLGAAAAGAAGAPGPVLRIACGPDAGRTIPFAPGDVVGRGCAAQVVLHDPAASREHARVERRGDALELVDLASKNGFEVNGRVARRRARLSDGDRVRIGTTVLEVSGTAALMETDVVGSGGAPETHRRRGEQVATALAPPRVRAALALLVATAAALLGAFA